MLHLGSRTSPSWGRWAIDNLDEILLDHAHCEKKAASTAINLIFRYAYRPQLMVPLSRLAREELEHFERVIGHVRRRGGEFERQHPSPYAARLMEIVRKEEPERLLDTLLCCALIEARSCERMQLVADALAAVPEHDERADADLLHLYRDLLACEARHHTGYLDLARGVADTDDESFERRLRLIAEHEAAVVADAPTVPRLHNATPADYEALTG